MNRLAEDRSGGKPEVSRSDELLAIENRIAKLGDWLLENGDGCQEKQAHLSDGPERVYWHYGYLVALRDVLDLLERKRRSLN